MPLLVFSTNSMSLFVGEKHQQRQNYSKRLSEELLEKILACKK